MNQTQNSHRNSQRNETYTPKLLKLFSRERNNNGGGATNKTSPEVVSLKENEENLAEVQETPEVTITPPAKKEWGSTRDDLDIGTTPGYDDQLIAWLSSLTVDGTIAPQIEYLDLSQLTRRAKLKLKITAIVLLDQEFSTTRIRNEKDWQRLQDEFQLVLIQIPIGLTKYDVTPEFLLAIQLLTIKFQAKLNKAKGGWFLDKIKSHRTETVEESRGSPSYQEEAEKKGIKDRILMSLR